MAIVLSQRIDTKSEYEDVPFDIYHFPRQYRSQIDSGDRFIYYQGDRWKKEYRYYFGCGVVGNVYPATDKMFYADLLDGRPFIKRVPIYMPEGGFYESIDYMDIRTKPDPPWRSSIRPISDGAFSSILEAAGIDVSSGAVASQIESATDAIHILRELNTQYAGLRPEARARKIASHLDRGSSVTYALKQLLGSKCQICGWKGFKKQDNSTFIEAHHLIQISERCVDSLCTENIILVCPNCHREIHYGDNVEINEEGDINVVRLSKKTARIPKNTIRFLEGVKNR